MITGFLIIRNYVRISDMGGEAASRNVLCAFIIGKVPMLRKEQIRQHNDNVTSTV